MDMQEPMIAAVKRFSKSVAIDIGDVDAGTVMSRSDLTSIANDQNRRIDSAPVARYLGHNVGADATQAANWQKAFSALITRLRLAELKTTLRNNGP
jgi:hypothetical protein